LKRIEGGVSFCEVVLQRKETNETSCNVTKVVAMEERNKQSFVLGNNKKAHITQ
jgi:hypothetical protein